MRIKNVNKNEYFIEENGVKILSYILAQDTLCIGSGDILIDDKLINIYEKNEIISIFT